MRIPLAGGSPEKVMDAEYELEFQCGREPIGCFISEYSEDQKTISVTAFDFMSGRRKLLRSVPSPSIGSKQFVDAVSPDGSTFALASNNGENTRIQLLSLSSGPDREFTLKGWWKCVGFDWSIDNLGFYVGFCAIAGTYSCP
jgi:hypothetical protein